MPEPPKLAKATLQEIRWNKKGDVEKKNAKGTDTTAVTVQFNPATLKVNYANQKAGGDQPAGSPVQFVGKGTTKLTLELWFDTTVTDTKGPGKAEDVRLKTREIFNFMKPTPGTGKNKKNFVPPGVRFHWGSFIFDGVIDSMDENLEFFSSSGVPMRASVSLALSQQELSFQVGEAEAEGAAGTSAFEEAQAGDSVQKMASKSGNPDWKGVALANGIENPRLLPPGALVNMSATGISASLGGASITGGAAIGASFGVAAGASFSAGASASAGASFGGGASLGGDASFGGAASFGAGGQLGGTASLDAGASLGVGAGFGAGASLGAGAGFGAGAELTAGASASASLDAGGGFSASAEASADASVR